MRSFSLVILRTKTGVDCGLIMATDATTSREISEHEFCVFVKMHGLTANQNMLQFSFVLSFKPLRKIRLDFDRMRPLSFSEFIPFFNLRFVGF